MRTIKKHSSQSALRRMRSIRGTTQFAPKRHSRDQTIPMPLRSNHGKRLPALRSHRTSGSEVMCPGHAAAGLHQPPVLCTPPKPDRLRHSLLWIWIQDSTSLLVCQVFLEKLSLGIVKIDPQSRTNTAGHFDLCQRIALYQRFWHKKAERLFYQNKRSAVARFGYLDTMQPFSVKLCNIFASFAFLITLDLHE